MAALVGVRQHSEGLIGEAESVCGNLPKLRGIVEADAALETPQRRGAGR